MIRMGELESKPNPLTRRNGITWSGIQYSKGIEPQPASARLATFDGLVSHPIRLMLSSQKSKKNLRAVESIEAYGG